MDCIEGMKKLEDNSIDSIVTDPPYELGFMGKSWDNSSIAYNIEMWKETFTFNTPKTDKKPKGAKLKKVINND